MSSPQGEPVSQPGAPPAAGGKPAPRVLGMPRPVAIVVIAAAAALGLIWWRGRHGQAASSSQAAAPTAATSQTVGLQDQLAQLQDEIDQLQAQGIGAGSGGSSGSGTPATPPPATTAPPAPMVKVPRVVGMSANQAIGALTSAGLGYHLSMERDPASEYVVFSQTPGAGQQLARGKVVDLGIKKR